MFLSPDINYRAKGMLHTLTFLEWRETQVWSLGEGRLRQGCYFWI